MPHINWNAQWESNFEPIRINDEVGIRAGFHPPFTDCRYDIVITPKMSFGTGHHETTRMILEYSCETDFEGKSVLDFGCGTGVLAILAHLKGAHPVLGSTMTTGRLRMPEKIVTGTVEPLLKFPVWIYRRLIKGLKSYWPISI
ncbi:ribosomal protein L11 methyltransferase [Filimonas sp.]|nr:ribosomal protein L11 methyltransferase [Filimonas sp.]